MQWYRLLVLVILLLQGSCREEDTPPESLSLMSARMGAIDLSGNPRDVPLHHSIELKFSAPVAKESVSQAISLKRDMQDVPHTIAYFDDDKTVVLDPVETLAPASTYTLAIAQQLRGSSGELFSERDFSFTTMKGALNVSQWTLGNAAPASDPITDVPLNLDLQVLFSEPLDEQSVNTSSVSLTGPSSPVLLFDFSDNQRQLTITTAEPLVDLAKYNLVINDQITGEQEETFTRFEIDFYTAINPAPDFPVLSGEALLTLVQEQTFKYFYDFAHPASGMARERNTSGDLVTSGGSGFGIMALVVGVERGFISRAEALSRMDKILTFLESADRFHGAWAHWMNGNTGEVIPFSANDNGGDLVETSFLIQGLLTFRQYLDPNIPEENSLVDRINALWHTVEWDWYTREGQDVLYWHWSPDKQWTMNHRIQGYNEALITYFLAAASPSHPVAASVYHNGWADGGSIKNNKSFYGINLPLGYDYGGPLFFAHYSFLGLDPRGLSDTYADYWTQNRNHSLIHHAYSMDNPKNYVGYSDENWGLTASDNQNGYSAHSPTNDLGVITPSAALSSFPYTPDESMKALNFFYYTLGDRLWGEYGFYDAFNITQGWTADSYLAIDQGPIIVMIENHRTGLLWDLFMSAPEVQVAMNKLGFTR